MNINKYILLIDKPYGWSSNFTLKHIKNIFNIKKIGYSGTLDKLSTGILPILINENTKYSKYFSKSNKCYNVLIYLGINTDTYDGSGKVTYIHNKEINFNVIYIKKILDKFLGEIIQITPFYSSFKYNKKKIRDYYTIYNKKIIIPRCVIIYNINIIYLEKNFLELEIFCSEGTYIRSIVNKIGKYLKCGAYTFALRRTKILNYTDKNLLTFDKIYKIINSVSNFNIYNLLNLYGIKINNYIK